MQLSRIIGLRLDPSPAAPLVPQPEDSRPAWANKGVR
jgi:hypothetical protein